MDKAPDAFRTISEVADHLDTPAHVLRFWETRFPQIKPVKGAGGRRYYRPADVALLSGIRRLLHTEGLTIRGVQKILRDHGVRHVAELGGESVEAPEPITALLRPATPRSDRPAAEIVAFPPSRSAGLPDPSLPLEVNLSAMDEAPPAQDAETVADDLAPEPIDETVSEVEETLDIASDAALAALDVHSNEDLATEATARDDSALQESLAEDSRTQDGEELVLADRDTAPQDSANSAEHDRPAQDLGERDTADQDPTAQDAAEQASLEQDLLPQDSAPFLEPHMAVVDDLAVLPEIAPTKPQLSIADLTASIRNALAALEAPPEGPEAEAAPAGSTLTLAPAVELPEAEAPEAFDSSPEPEEVPEAPFWSEEDAFHPENPTPDLPPPHLPAPDLVPAESLGAGQPEDASLPEAAPLPEAEEPPAPLPPLGFGAFADTLDVPRDGGGGFIAFGAPPGKPLAREREAESPLPAKSPSKSNIPAFETEPEQISLFDVQGFEPEGEASLVEEPAFDSEEAPFLAIEDEAPLETAAVLTFPLAPEAETSDPQPSLPEESVEEAIAALQEDTAEADPFESPAAFFDGPSGDPILVPALGGIAARLRALSPAQRLALEPLTDLQARLELLQALMAEAVSRAPSP